MFLRVYCQSYDFSCSWGSWFDVSCQDDIACIYHSATAHGVEEILTADYEGDLSYNALGGESMLYFLQSHWEQLEYIFSFDYPDMVFEYLFDSYNIDRIFDMIEDFSYIEINKGESYTSVEVLTGYYFFDMLDVSGILLDILIMRLMDGIFYLSIHIWKIVTVFICLSLRIFRPFGWIPLL